MAPRTLSRHTAHRTPSSGSIWESSKRTLASSDKAARSPRNFSRHVGPAIRPLRIRSTSLLSSEFSALTRIKSSWTLERVRKRCASSSDRRKYSYAQPAAVTVSATRVSHEGRCTTSMAILWKRHAPAATTLFCPPSESSHSPETSICRVMGYGPLKCLKHMKIWGKSPKHRWEADAWTVALHAWVGNMKVNLARCYCLHMCSY